MRVFSLLWCLLPLVALNYQTPDEDMHIYKGFFLDNGGCGYVLKPGFLCGREYRVLVP